MTLEETRQLGIEFERRVLVMIPEKEFAAKLDTETIYSFLNQYQDKLIHDLYKAADLVPPSNTKTYVETLLQGLITSVEIPASDAKQSSRPNNILVQLPKDFGLYIDSYSTTESTYRFKGSQESSGGVVPNTLVPVKDVNKIIQRPQDSMRILRNPAIYLTENMEAGVIYDVYTTLTSIQINYYRVPKYMNILTSDPCELPMEMFEPLVSGAVDTYVQYVAGAEARKRQLAEQLQRQQKRNNENE